jgi:hypothetical protein
MKLERNIRSDIASWKNILWSVAARRRISPGDASPVLKATS